MSIKVQMSPKVLLRLQGQVQKTHLPKEAIKCQSLFSRSCYFLYLGAGESLSHVCSAVSRTRSSLKIVNRWKVHRRGGGGSVRARLPLGSFKKVTFLIGNCVVVFGFQLLIQKRVNAERQLPPAGPALCTEEPDRQTDL